MFFEDESKKSKNLEVSQQGDFVKDGVKNKNFTSTFHRRVAARRFGSNINLRLSPRGGDEVRRKKWREKKKEKKKSRAMQHRETCSTESSRCLLGLRGNLETKVCFLGTSTSSSTMLTCEFESPPLSVFS